MFHGGYLLLAAVSVGVCGVIPFQRIERNGSLDLFKAAADRQGKEFIETASYFFRHKESRQTVISHKSVGSASVRLALYGYCFLITVICKSFASIKLSCLHFGQ